MSKVWRYTDTHSEGKYLVVRRDGTIPAWPHFVLSASDIATPETLRAYARIADAHRYDPEYVASVIKLADDFQAYRLSHPHGALVSDPDAGPHRIDDPMIIRAMRATDARIHIDTIDTTD